MRVYRNNELAGIEIQHIVLADIVMIVSFSLFLSGGIYALSSGSRFLMDFLSFIPIVAVGVTLSFILHELMHKFVAQHYGAIAGFRTSPMGLAITLITSAFGFMIGIPGATMIYAHNFTKRHNGIVSLAGPLTNLAVFAVFLLIGIAANPPAASYMSLVISFTIFINLFLAFFNMLPIFPLDGSKVFVWNKPVYFAMMALLIVLLITFTAISWTTIAFMLFVAIMFSMMYRQVL
ncbi:MAG: site-2 protease family protein [Candidatus Micrarchaeota archaeon]|nr:site-2 protease family protein [Candidatus Micrarchaeota archaeon]